MRSKTHIEKFEAPPLNSNIKNGFPKIDYCDSYSLRVPKDIEISNDDIFNITFEYPRWIRILFKLRDLLVKPFGIETGFEAWEKSKFYNVGDKLKFFEVISRNEQEIVVWGSDSHLEGSLSIMQVEKQSFKIIYLTTIVNYHHLGGRIYFIPIIPFHRIIVKYMMKKLHKTL